jgi:hypothetical protein
MSRRSSQKRAKADSRVCAARVRLGRRLDAQTGYGWQATE